MPFQHPEPGGKFHPTPGGRGRAPDSGSQAGLARWLDRRLLATQGTLLFCVIVFGLCVAVDRRLPMPGSDAFRTATMLGFGALFPTLVAYEPWRLLSAVFVHFDLLHLGLNMWGLVSLGTLLEQRFGSPRAFVLFVTSGVVGFVVSCFWYALAGGGLTAGASGGIFGQLGALIGIMLARKNAAWKQVLWQNLAYAVIMGFMLPLNNAAHFGGLACGLGLGYLFERRSASPRSERVFSAIALLAALASVASVALSYRSVARQLAARGWPGLDS